MCKTTQTTSRPVDISLQYLWLCDLAESNKIKCDLQLIPIMLTNGFKAGSIRTCVAHEM